MTPEASFHNETHLADLCFAIHCFIAISVLIGQYCYYPKGDNKVTLLWGTVSILAVIFIVCVGIFDKDEENMFLLMGLVKIA